MTSEAGNTGLQELLEAGEFVVTAEIGPPVSGSGARVTSLARELKGFVDGVNLTDNQVAAVRMSSMAAAVLALSQGVEPVMQMTCRDRNRIALQSDLLGAWALGIRSVLCLSGNHQSMGDHPQAKNVFDLDAVQLLGALRRMKEEGVFVNGEACKTPARFFLGATANPFADPPELQLTRLGKKIRAGAQFIQTEFIYDVARFSRWMEAVRAHGYDRDAHILAGILICRSAEALRRIRHNTKISIPDFYIARMERASDKTEEGIEIAAELIRDLREIPGVHGVHIMAVGWEEAVPLIAERAGLLPRPKAGARKGAERNG